MALSVKVDFDDLKVPKRVINAIIFDHKFIVAQALTATMTGVKTIPTSKLTNVRTALERDSVKYLDRPKQQIKTAWFNSEYANKNNLNAGLNFKDKPFNTYRYLFPHIAGTIRKQKAAEQRLINHPLASKPKLPPNSKLVPNLRTGVWNKSPLKIDNYGNVSLKSWEYIYKNVHSLRATGHRQSLKTGKQYSNPTFLVGKPKVAYNRPPGVYWRLKDNKELKMVFKAVDRVSYEARYKADETFKNQVRMMWGYNFSKSVDNTINPLIR